MKRRRPSSPSHLPVADPTAVPEPRKVIAPASGMDAMAIIANFAAETSGTVALVTDQAMHAMADVIESHGFARRVDDDGGALRAAIKTVVVNRLRDLVIEKLTRTTENPALLDDYTDREALIYLLSDDDDR